MPLNPPDLPIHPDVQVVLLTHRNLRRMQDPLRPIVKTQQHVHVVIQQTPLHKRRDVRRQFADLQPGDVFRQILCMRPDVTHAATSTALRWIRPPTRLLLPARLKPRRQPSLRILHHHFPDLPELPGLNHVPRLLHQRIPGVVMRQSIQPPARLHHFPKCLRLRQIKTRRLVAQHVKPILQRQLRRRKMHVIRRHNRHKIHPLTRRQRLLLLNHLLKRPVTALSRQEKIRTGCLRSLGVRRKRTADEFNLLINCGRNAVHSANKCATPAADHAHPDFSVHVRGRMLSLSCLMPPDLSHRHQFHQEEPSGSAVAAHASPSPHRPAPDPATVIGTGTNSRITPRSSLRSSITFPLCPAAAIVFPSGLNRAA